MRLIRNPDGSYVGSNDLEGRANANGSPAVDRWTFADAQHMGKFLRGVRLATHPLKTVPAGEISAAEDDAAEFAKQRAS